MVHLEAGTSTKRYLTRGTTKRDFSPLLTFCFEINVVPTYLLPNDSFKQISWQKMLKHFYFRSIWGKHWSHTRITCVVFVYLWNELTHIPHGWNALQWAHWFMSGVVGIFSTPVCDTRGVEQLQNLFLRILVAFAIIAFGITIHNNKWHIFILSV